ncbi:MAG: efflux RND transporter periplasmic adaptor subunit [Sedimenticola sp.]
MIRVLVLISALSVSAIAAAEKVDARLDWAQRVELATPLSGVVGKVLVTPGQRVKAGEELLLLDQRRFEARRNKASALLAEAKEDRAEADRQLERALDLYDRTVISNYDRNVAEIDKARADALWHSARAALAESRVDLEQSRILAPFDGVVLSVSANPGQVVVNRMDVQTLIVLADDSQLRATALVSADRLEGISPGQAADVGVAGDWSAGKVVHVGLEPVAENERGPLYELGVVFKRPQTLAPRVGLPAVIRINE